jgi:ketosteroid isomerase-like protein
MADAVSERVSELAFEEMIRELWDRQAIRAVIDRYSRGVDRQDRELVMGCYHPDAIDDRALFAGPASEFFDWTFPSHLRLFRTHQHIVANHTCELAGDIAHCETYFLFAAMTEADNSLALAGGRYLDRMEKRGGEWRIALRKCLTEWGSEGMQSEGAAALNAAVGTVARDRSDESYRRPLTSDPARFGLKLGV